MGFVCFAGTKFWKKFERRLSLKVLTQYSCSFVQVWPHMFARVPVCLSGLKQPFFSHLMGVWLLFHIDWPFSLDYIFKIVSSELSDKWVYTIISEDSAYLFWKSNIKSIALCSSKEWGLGTRCAKEAVSGGNDMAGSQSSGPHTAVLCRRTDNIEISRLYGVRGWSDTGKKIKQGKGICQWLVPEASFAWFILHLPPFYLVTSPFP